MNSMVEALGVGDGEYVDFPSRRRPLNRVSFMQRGAR